MRCNLIGLIAALALSASSAFAADFGTFPIDKANVIGVYDGDTFFISEPDCPPVLCQKIGVRIAGIDTPEMHSKCPFERFKALQAKAALKEAIDNGSQIELQHVGREKFGRLLGQLYVDGTNIGDKMIGMDLARPYFGEKKLSWCE